MLKNTGQSLSVHSRRKKAATRESGGFWKGIVRWNPVLWAINAWRTGSVYVHLADRISYALSFVGHDEEAWQL